ncbi:hypothetical protein SADUNF_Sadunf01G0140200 [Salix dunnii]|uniref:Uncharacterized protein n=1 Tax=Salix dunnii TaxID=1413687 RepID=A0A835TNK0_9ROSI|nr:hypothetical protein SADUNF_Sadunf01G0140200 [Salix dunnii]
MEVEPPSPLRYIIGAAIMMIGVVLPVGYMMFRNKRGPSSSSTYSKQTRMSSDVAALQNACSLKMVMVFCFWFWTNVMGTPGGLGYDRNILVLAEKQYRIIGE